MSNASNIIASDLCQACNLCCTGVLFQTVRLHPGDQPHTLNSLGLRLKKKQGRHLIQQPCPAHQDGCCSIYLDRPSRCRLFECDLLKKVEAGGLPAEDALEMIHDTVSKVRDIHQLLSKLGNKKTSQPLFPRCDSTLADTGSTAEEQTQKKNLREKAVALQQQLNAHFHQPNP